jgi:hypothetical protein
MKHENTTSYSKEIARIFKAYNDTPNSGILYIAPNAVEADKENTDKLQMLNHEHDYQNIKNRIHLNIGDTVRIRLNKKQL